MKRSILLISILLTIVVVIALSHPPFCKPLYDEKIPATSGDYPPFPENTKLLLNDIRAEDQCLYFTVTNSDTVANYILPSTVYIQIGQEWYLLNDLSPAEKKHMRYYYTKHEQETDLWSSTTYFMIAPGETVTLHIDYPKRYGIFGPGEYLFQYYCTEQGNYSRRLSIPITIK